MSTDHSECSHYTKEYVVPFTWNQTLKAEKQDLTMDDLKAAGETGE